MLIVIARMGKLAAAMDEVYGVLRQERHLKPGRPGQLRHHHRRADGRGLPQDDVGDRHRHGGAEFHRAAGGGVGVMNIMLVSGDRADQGDRHTPRPSAPAARTSLRSSSPRLCANRAGRPLGMFWAGCSRSARAWCFPAIPTTVPLWAAVMASPFGRRRLFSHLARGEGGAPGPRRGAQVRVRRGGASANPRLPSIFQSGGLRTCRAGIGDRKASCDSWCYARRTSAVEKTWPSGSSTGFRRRGNWLRLYSYGMTDTTSGRGLFVKNKTTIPF